MREGEPKFEIEPQTQEVRGQGVEKESKWREVEQQLEKFGGIEGGIKDTVVALNVFGIETVNSCEGHNNHGRIAPWASIEKWESKPNERFAGQKEFEEEAYKRLGVTELNRNYSEYLREFDRRRAEILGPGKAEPDSEEMGKKIGEMHNEVEKQFGITPEITKRWMDAGMQVDNEVEEAGRDGRLQETEEYKKWKTENDAMKDGAQRLLNEFYKDRKVSKNTRIIIDQDAMGMWRLHNGGKDYYDVTRKQDEISDADKKHYQKILDGKNPKKERDDIERHVEKYREEFKKFAEFCRNLNSKNTEGEQKITHESIEQEVSPEFLETLERTPFSPEDQVWILLTKAGLKPASWPDFVIRNEENNGKINKKLSDEEVNLAISFLEDNFPCSQERKTRKTTSTETGKEMGEEEQISFIIGSTQENFEKLSLAIKAGNEREIGLALGFEPTAVEAYCGNGSIVDNEKLPEKVLFSEAFAFNPGRLSADHWREELAQYQKWADYVKKIRPSLFKRMMGFQQNQVID